MKQVTSWFEQIRNKYMSGISNIFVLTGNIGDYAVPGKMFLNYLAESLILPLKMEEVYTYDLNTGVHCEYTSPNQELEHKFDSLINEDSKTDSWWNMLSLLQQKGLKRAFIVRYPEFVIPNAPIEHMDETTKTRLIALHKTINGISFLDSNNILIFVTDVKSNINNMFIGSNSRTVPIHIPFPDETERLECIEYLKNTGKKDVNWEVDVAQFAKLTAGLSRVNLEDIVLLAEATEKLTRSMIMDRKKELMMKEYGEVIEIFDTDGYSLKDFAGLDHIKGYLNDVVIQPILEGDTAIVPKGILLMGSPGTGKTHLARCLAGEAGINFVEFKMSKILDKWVGEAEKNLEKALNCFESLAPVGVFIDEIDQALGRGENDGNSVNKNLFGMFLAFLSEPSHRGRIIFLGATNYPNKMDEAMKRAGRFDKKIPFLPPNAEERVEVFKMHLKKSKFNYDIKNYDQLANLTQGYTQAEIENIVVKALEVARRKKLTTITDETMEYAIDCILHAQNDKIKEMTKIAIDECNDREFLPSNYKEYLE